MTGALASLLFLGSAGFAAPPKMDYAFPAGAQVGQTIDVVLHGTFDPWPVQVWVDRPGVSFTPKEKKGEATATVAPDALPGVYWLRAYNAEGATALAPFVVSNLTEVRDQEPNNSASKPQELPSANVVVNGKLDRKGDVDTFAVRLDQGQTLIAEIEAHRTLGAPLDAVLEIVSPAGFVLAHNDDDQEIDPRIIFVAPQSGIYLVRVFGFPATPDSSIALAGGDPYLYRLTVTAAGFLDYTMPLAVSAATQTIEARGWNLPADLHTLSPTVLPEPNRIMVAHPLLGNVLTLPVEPHPSILAIEPSAAGQPQSVTLPVTITGRIEAPRDKDTFRFAAQAGETLSVRVESRALGYPLDPVLELFDNQGKSLVRVDDAGESRDAQLTYAVPATGEYTLAVSDLHRQGGPRFVYRLTAVVARPDFALSLAADAFIVKAGEKLELPVTIDRLQGFKESIALHVEGLPGSASLEPVTSLGGGESAKAVKLVIAAGEAPFSGPIHIVGTAAGASPMSRKATAPISGRTLRTSTGWLTITSAAAK